MAVCSADIGGERELSLGFLDICVSFWLPYFRGLYWRGVHGCWLSEEGMYVGPGEARLREHWSRYYRCPSFGMA